MFALNNLRRERLIENTGCSISITSACVVGFVIGDIQCITTPFLHLALDISLSFRIASYQKMFFCVFFLLYFFMLFFVLKSYIYLIVELFQEIRKVR